MKYQRMPIEIESPEQLGYDAIRCNLTESSMTDLKINAPGLGLDLEGLVLCYTDHAGKPELRELIAAEGEGLGAGDVIVTVGAAAALFIIATSLLEPEDRILVTHPNYATNIETPRAIGCGVDFLELDFDAGWRLDIERMKALLTPRTKLISLTTPHNPTGAVISEADLRAAITVAEAHGCRLLVDETYRDMALDGPTPLAASLSPCAISVSSLSKTYGMPGIRTGWILTKDPLLQELFLAAKEQIFICNSVVDEQLAYALLSRKDQVLPEVIGRIRTALGVVRDWMATRADMEWVEPRGGTVCFPRIRRDSGVDVDAFYRILNREYGTYVGPGHWFEMDRSYLRIGFGWPGLDELRKGLHNMALALDMAKA